MQLILNADDFGASDDINVAIDYCFRNAFIHTASLMVNMDRCDEAVALAKSGGYDGKIGLHLNLTAGKPLTEPIKATRLCTDGRFNGSAINGRVNRFYLNRKTRKAVWLEITAQIEKYLALGFSSKHLDSHEHVHTNPSIFLLLYPVLRKYGFLSLRLSRNIPQNEISGIKGIYKKLFNAKVAGFNARGGTKWSAQYFGDQHMVTQVMEDPFYSDATIEVEVHPVWSTGKVADHALSEDFEFWVRELREKKLLFRNLDA